MSPSLWGALLLLVVGDCVMAHARHLAPTELTQQVVTSLATAGVAQGVHNSKSNNNNNKDSSNNVDKNAHARHSRRILLSLEDAAVSVRSPSSVVQDWSLVCKQLCRAGLGGAPCAAHCNSSDTPAQQQQANADALLNSSDKHAICHDLCRLQLGDVACKCAVTHNSHAKQTDFDPLMYNAVCTSFCRHNATLIGCSLCDDGVLAETEATTSTDEHMTTTAVKALSNDGVLRDGIITTTPDWNQLCVTLCKTGDGGSLCNCDLSPFRLKLLV